VAWCRGNSNLSTHAVGTKAPNGLGLFDMNGNVNEWCADTYMSWSYKKHKRNNPLFRLEKGEVMTYNRLYRGGSWNSKPKLARCAARSYEIGIVHQYNQGHRSNDLGFRLVRSK
jgi:formylglycine-generating enzyme required for sulfatase activity